MNAATGPQALAGADAYAEKLLALVRGARLELLLLSEALDPRLYRGESLADAVRDFALASPRARLRLLVREPRAALRNSPALVELARCMTSHIELREPADDQREACRGERLIADRRAVLERLEAAEPFARLWDAAPAQAKLRAEDFDALWNEAQPSQELRRLRL